jgi:antitoxin VapB
MVEIRQLWVNIRDILWGEMPMTQTTLFQSNRSQAVRLPKDVAFPPNVQEVTILRDGPRRIIVPADSVWDDFFDSPRIDLGERDQPVIQARELL